MSLLPNEQYTKRLIEKLERAVELNGPDCPQVAELAILKQTVTGVPAEPPKRGAEKSKDKE